MSPNSLCLLVAAALYAGGCGLDPGSPPRAAQTLDPSQPASLGGGRIFIGWTVGGSAPSTSVCAGVDHLALSLAYRDGSEVTIEPIPCTIGRLRYDGLYEGSARLDLSAYDANGCRIAGGGVDLSVTQALPPMPAPTVPIAAPRACR